MTIHAVKNVRSESDPGDFITKEKLLKVTKEVMGKTEMNKALSPFVSSLKDMGEQLSALAINVERSASQNAEVSFSTLEQVKETLEEIDGVKEVLKSIRNVMKTRVLVKAKEI